MRPRLLYVTDLAYPARGRRYGDEDVWLTARLQRSFALALCHPLDAPELMDGFDGVVVRNSGPVLGHLEAYRAFRARALETGIPVFSEQTGKGDQTGKRYLLELDEAGFPVIPTAGSHGGLARLPAAAEYVVKHELGADSIGIEVVAAERLATLVLDGVLVQPRVELVHEVSFVYVDRTFHYALVAPDPERRWALERHEPPAAEIAFADRFVAWNTIDHGIQRVDACRTRDGELLLVELEDLNPYLSLDLLDAATRDALVEAMTDSIRRLLAGRPG